MNVIIYQQMVSTETSAENLAKLADPNRGRIVGIGLSEDGESYRLFTGMGGRSDGSKNRYYQRVTDLNGNGIYIRTAVHDPSKQQGDPSATLYVAHRSWNGCHVASNGEQTDGISFALAFNIRFKDAHRKYKNEGPKNDYTPRITVALAEAPKRIYIGQIIPNPGNPVESYYKEFELFRSSTDCLEPGLLVFTTTYDGKGGTGANHDRPWKVALRGNLEQNMETLWNAWDPNTRANLVGKEVNKGSGRFHYAFRSIHPGR